MKFHIIKVYRTNAKVDYDVTLESFSAMFAYVETWFGLTDFTMTQTPNYAKWVFRGADFSIFVFYSEVK